MSIIEINDLAVNFGRKQVLKNLCLTVKPGTVCALLGPNGAGKTTLIRTLVNIYRPRHGRSFVFGVPSEKLGPEHFRRIGYVSENQDLPLWMKVNKFLKFCASFYPNWDHAWCSAKLEAFNLPGTSTLQQLSRGMRTKAVLISALAYHPELLILDEPFTGLDPVVRDEFIDLVLELAAENKATTFISSHDLHEVERIADSIAFLGDGKIDCHLPLDDLLNRFRLVSVELPQGAVFSSTQKPNWLSPSQEGNLVRFADSAYSQDTLTRDLKESTPGAVIKDIKALSLKEIYRVLAGKDIV